MNLLFAAIVILAGTVSPISPAASAQTATAGQDPAPGERIAACALVPKEEVKRHIPWIAALDALPIEETPVGAGGSSCNYPTVDVQVLPFTQNLREAVLRQSGIAPISGVGDEAYFRHNPAGYAEIFVKVGGYVVTLQADDDGGIEAAKTRVVNLANVYVAKLR